MKRPGLNEIALLLGLCSAFHGVRWLARARPTSDPSSACYHHADVSAISADWFRKRSAIYSERAIHVRLRLLA